MQNAASSARSNVSQAARTAMVLMSCRGDLLQAERIAGTTFPHEPAVAAYFKGAISAGGTSDVNWAASLAAHAQVVDGFVTAQRAASVLGKLRGVRRVPFSTRTMTATTGSRGAFVSEGAPAPVSAMGFQATQLAFAKYQVLVVFTGEISRVWSAASEAQIGDDMVAATVAGIDLAFLGDPSAITDPPSILHGIAPVRASTGATVAAITDDVKALLTAQVNAGNSLVDSVFVMSSRSALHFSTLRDTAGQLAFPSMNAIGTGTLFGLPALVSGGVALAGSPNDSYIALLCPRRILLADDGQATLDTSRHAALQMQSEPSSGGQPLVDLWSKNLTALKISRWINWARADSSAASWLSDVQF